MRIRVDRALGDSSRLWAEHACGTGYEREKIVSEIAHMSGAVSTVTRHKRKKCHEQQDNFLHGGILVRIVTIESGLYQVKNMRLEV